MGEETAPAETGVINRRRLLQGAVAAGVGAVAWTSPSISSLGGTPAYAAVCTGGIQTFVLDYRNTACNCGNPNDPGGKYVSYKDPGNTQQCPVANVVPREVTFWQGDNDRGSYPPLGNAGKCPPDPLSNPEGAYARIAPIPGSAITYNLCRLKVEAMDGNCENLTVRPNGTAYSDVVDKTETKYVAMPRVRCQGAGNVFLRVSLECADAAACFP